MASSAVSDRISLESVLLGREKEADKVCLCEDVIGCSCGIVGLVYNEELYVPDTERVVGGIGASFAVLAGPEEEEEGDPGEIDDGDVYWVGSLGGGVQVLNDVNREGSHSCRRIIFFLIGHHLASHPKVDF